MILAEAVSPFVQVGQYGAVGVLAGILATVGRYVYKREANRADELEAELKRVNQSIIDKYVPALESTSKALMDAQTVITDQRAELRVLRDQRG